MRNLEEQFESLKQQTETQQAAPQAAAPTLSFVSPTEVVELPSGGLFYPENHPLHKKNSVEIKQMTAKEEDILTNKSFIKKGVVIDKLIESILVDKTIQVNSLLVGDKNAIMVAARINAYGPSYEVTVNCLECSSKNSLDINLDDISVRNTEKIDELAAKNEKLKHQRLDNGNIVITLPKAGWNVTCKLLTSEDERRIVSFLENKKKLNGQDAEISLSEQLQFIILEINEINDKNTIRDAISLMPAFDAKHLRTSYIKLIPNVIIEKKLVCSSCSAEQELEVPFTQEFFWPK